MAIMKIRNVGTKGVIKDLPSFELPPDAWSHANNVRFMSGKIEKIGGYFPVLTKGMPESPPLAILSRNNTQDQIYGTKDSLYLITGRQHLNVSKESPNPKYVPPTIPNPNYDPNKKIDNPDFDDRKEITNPNYNPLKPEDNNETIKDPDNPDKEIPNPNYNPSKVANPAYDPRETIDNPKYDPEKNITNPAYDPSAPAVDPTIIHKYEASPDNTWYYTTLSNAIVMNTPLENPQGLVPYKDRFTDLPGWGWPSKNKRPDPEILGEKAPADWKAGRIRSFRNYLIALDMTEGGVHLPQRVRWSNVAYVNELPPDWIEDDVARDGGFNDMTDANGRIIDGVPLRDSFVIYTDQETYLMDYVGGVLIWQFKKLFSDSGILAPECAVEFEQKHFVIAKDDIFVHNGSSRQPVASGRVKQYLIDEISSVNPAATKVFAYTPKKEIWITYVGSGQSAGELSDSDYDSDRPWKCNRCAIWNWEWDTWYFMDIPECYDVNMAPPPDLETKEWAEFGGIGQEDVTPGTEAPPAEDQDTPDWWDNPAWEKYQWSELGKDFVNRIPYMASPDKCLYTIDVGESQIKWNSVYDIHGQFVKFEEKSTPVIAEMLRTHLDMDEVVESTRHHKFIRHITPQFRGFGNIHCFVGGSFNATQEPEWDNYQVFDLEEDVKIDAFSNNRYPAIRFVDFGKGEWSFQGYDIDFVVEGNR